MDYEKEGILASIERSENLVIVKDFEIKEDLIMAFGEEHYLPALKKFLAWIEFDAPNEIHIKVERSGYRMLLARFGYTLENDVMFKRKESLKSTSDTRLAAATFDHIANSAFAENASIRMTDGSCKPVLELGVGEEVAIGGLVIATFRVCRGYQPSKEDLNEDVSAPVLPERLAQAVIKGGADRKEPSKKS